MNIKNSNINNYDVKQIGNTLNEQKKIIYGGLQEVQEVNKDNKDNEIENKDKENENKWPKKEYGENKYKEEYKKDNRFNK